MRSLLVAPNAPSVSLSDAVSLAKAGTVSTEVVVVGTGAGGAVAGTELARRGKKVLFLEAGGAFAQPHFQKKQLSWSTAHLYAGHGPQSTTGDAVMVIPQGRVVGGSTVLNEGICFRPPDVRLDEWVRLTGAQHLAPAAMAPFVDEVWARLGIMATHEGIGRRNNALMRDGLVALDAQAARAVAGGGKGGGAVAEHGWIHRNAPTCLGCGVCHLGCPSGAKASVDKAWLPEAANLGADVLIRARAEAVIVEGGRAKGVVAAVVDERTDEKIGELRVHADVVIIAGSAIGTPLVLQQSDVKNAQHLGQHLALHPGFGVMAEFAENVDLWNGVPQGYWGHVPGDDRVTLEAQGLGPVELYGLMGRAGHPELALNFRRYALAGAMIRDEGGGSVRLKNAATFRPDIKVRLAPGDFEAFRNGGKHLVRLWFAAGAKRVAPFSVPFRFYDREQDALDAIDTVKTAADVLQVHASHPQGTCRMGATAADGVVDGNAQVHGTPGLYVIDGSIFPSTLGTNPQVTIQALSLMLARRLAAG